jgi:hypothetical protein
VDQKGLESTQWLPVARRPLDWKDLRQSQKKPSGEEGNWNPRSQNKKFFIT